MPTLDDVFQPPAAPVTLDDVFREPAAPAAPVTLDDVFAEPTAGGTPPRPKSAVAQVNDMLQRQDAPILTAPGPMPLEQRQRLQGAWDQFQESQRAAAPAFRVAGEAQDEQTLAGIKPVPVDQIRIPTPPAPYRPPVMRAATDEELKQQQTPRGQDEAAFLRYVQNLSQTNPEAAARFFDGAGNLIRRGTPTIADDLERGLRQLQLIGVSGARGAADLVGIKTPQLDQEAGRINMLLQKNPALVASMDEIGVSGDKVRDALAYAQRAIAEQAPMSAPSYVTGGAGGIIGRQLAARTIGKLVAEEAAKKLATATAKGAAAGAMVGSTGLEFGSITGDMADAGARGPKQSAVALLASLPAGALDAIGPYFGVRRIMGKSGREFSEQIVDSAFGTGAARKPMGQIGGSVLEQIYAESLPEFLQTGIEQAAVISQDPAKQGEFLKNFLSEGASKERWEAAMQALIASVPTGVAVAAPHAAKTWMQDRVPQQPGIASPDMAQPGDVVQQTPPPTGSGQPETPRTVPVLDPQGRVVAMQQLPASGGTPDATTPTPNSQLPATAAAALPEVDPYNLPDWTDQELEARLKAIAAGKPESGKQEAGGSSQPPAVSGQPSPVAGPAQISTGAVPATKPGAAELTPVPARAPSATAPVPSLVPGKAESEKQKAEGSSQPSAVSGQPASGGTPTAATPQKDVRDMGTVEVVRRAIAIAGEDGLRKQAEEFQATGAAPELALEAAARRIAFDAQERSSGGTPDATTPNSQLPSPAPASALTPGDLLNVGAAERSSDPAHQNEARNALVATFGDDAAREVWQTSGGDWETVRDMLPKSVVAKLDQARALAGNVEGRMQNAEGEAGGTPDAITPVAKPPPLGPAVDLTKALKTGEGKPLSSGQRAVVSGQTAEGMTLEQIKRKLPVGFDESTARIENGKIIAREKPEYGGRWMEVSLKKATAEPLEAAPPDAPAAREIDTRAMAERPPAETPEQRKARHAEVERTLAAMRAASTPKAEQAEAVRDTPARRAAFLKQHADKLLQGERPPDALDAARALTASGRKFKTPTEWAGYSQQGKLKTGRNQEEVVNLVGKESGLPAWVQRMFSRDGTILLDTGAEKMREIGALKDDASGLATGGPNEFLDALRSAVQQHERAYADFLRDGGNPYRDMSPADALEARRLDAEEAKRLTAEKRRGRVSKGSTDANATAVTPTDEARRQPAGDGAQPKADGGQRPQSEGSAGGGSVGGGPRVEEGARSGSAGSVVSGAPPDSGKYSARKVKGDFVAVKVENGYFIHKANSDGKAVGQPVAFKPTKAEAAAEIASLSESKTKRAAARQRVQAAADKKHGKGEITVVDQENIPSDVKKQAAEQGANPRAFYLDRDGKIYVVVENIPATNREGQPWTTEEALDNSFKHELMHGLKDVIGEERYNRFLQRVREQLPQAHLDYLANRYKLDPNTPAGIEEIGARVGEDVDMSSAGVLRDIWRRIVAAVREQWHRIFGNRFGKMTMTENDVRQMLRRAREGMADVRAAKAEGGSDQAARMQPGENVDKPAWRDKLTGDESDAITRDNITNAPTRITGRFVRADVSQRLAEIHARQNVRWLQGAARSHAGGASEKVLGGRLAGGIAGRFNQALDLHPVTLADLGLPADAANTAPRFWNELRSTKMEVIAAEGESIVLRSGDVVYKVFLPYPDSTISGAGRIERLSNGQLSFKTEGGNVRDILEKLRVLSALGGTPSELVGMTPEGAVVVKMPYAPEKKSGSVGDMLDRARLARIPQNVLPTHGDGAWLAVVDGKPYAIGDMRPDNYLTDNSGRRRINDIILAPIPDAAVVGNPRLAQLILEARAQEPATNERARISFQDAEPENAGGEWQRYVVRERMANGQPVWRVLDRMNNHSAGDFGTVEEARATAERLQQTHADTLPAMEPQRNLPLPVAAPTAAQVDAAPLGSVGAEIRAGDAEHGAVKTLGKRWWGLAHQSALDVLGHAGGRLAETIAPKVNAYFDRMHALRGKFLFRINNPIARSPKAQVTQALDEFARYMTVAQVRPEDRTPVVMQWLESQGLAGKTRKELEAAASPLGRTLIKTARGVLDDAAKLTQAARVQIRDSNTGQWLDFKPREDYWQSSVTTEIGDVLRDRSNPKNRAAFDKLAEELAQHIQHRWATRAQAAVQDVLTRPGVPETLANPEGNPALFNATVRELAQRFNAREFNTVVRISETLWNSVDGRRKLAEFQGTGNSEELAKFISGQLLAVERADMANDIEDMMAKALVRDRLAAAPATQALRLELYRIAQAMGYVKGAKWNAKLQEHEGDPAVQARLTNLLENTPGMADALRDPDHHPTQYKDALQELAEIFALPRMDGLVKRLSDSLGTGRLGALLVDKAITEAQWQEVHKELSETANEPRLMSSRKRILTALDAGGVANLMATLKPMPRRKAERIANAALEDWNRQNVAPQLNGRFGSIETGRIGGLPPSWMKYRYEESLPGYVESWADRLAQIENFGQGATDATPDLFERTIRDTADQQTKEYLDILRQDIYGSRINVPVAVRTVRAALTGMLIGNPATSIRNLSTDINTLSQFGVRAWARSLWEMANNPRVTVDEARRSGALQYDILSSMTNIANWHEQERRIVNGWLKWGGQYAGEVFLRTHAATSARIAARLTLDALEADPANKSALAVKAMLARHGINLDTLKAEGAEGEHWDKLMRMAATNTQFAYDLRQVPLYGGSREAYVMLFLQKFGVQQYRRLMEDVLKPIVKGDVVATDAGSVAVRRQAAKRFALWAAGYIGMGEVVLLLRALLWGKDRPDASLEEIVNTIAVKPSRGIKLGLQRMGMDILYAGGVGIVGDVGQSLWNLAGSDWKGKTPLQSAMLSVPGSLVTWLQHVGQGGFRWRAIRDATDELFQTGLPAYNYAKAGTSRLLSATGAAPEWVQARDAAQDVAHLRRLMYRFADENQMDRKTRGGGTPDWSLNTPLRRELKDALLRGDAADGKALRDEAVAEAGNDPEKVQRVLASLRGYVSLAHPTHLGGLTPDDRKEMKRDFRAWVQEREPSSLPALDAVTARYEATAASLGLRMDPEREKIREQAQAIEEGRTKQAQVDAALVKAAVKQGGISEEQAKAGLSSVMIERLLGGGPQPTEDFRRAAMAGKLDGQGLGLMLQNKPEVVASIYGDNALTPAQRNDQLRISGRNAFLSRIESLEGRARRFITIKDILEKAGKN